MRVVNPLSRIGNRKTLALVLAGGSGTRLRGLTQQRAKPAVPFGGQHRIIDYALSNCINSKIVDIAVLTQYKAQTLTEHLQRNWLSRGGIGADAIEVWPAQQRNGQCGYAGTADAVYQNRDLIEAVDPDDVLIIAGDHIYEMDFSSLLTIHADNGADVTLSCVEVPASDCHRFGIVETDAMSRLTSFVEKPDRLPGIPRDGDCAFASMGIYVFSADYLLSCLDGDARDPDSRHDFGYSIVPRIVGDADVFVAPFRTGDGKPGYWRDVGAIDSYWLAHMELLDRAARDPGAGCQWPLLGAHAAKAPAEFASAAKIETSIVAGDSYIAGDIRRSVVSTGCQVEQGARITDSVLLPDVSIGSNCTLNRVIVDSRCHIPDDTVIDARYLSAVDDFYVAPNGVVLVTAEGLHYGLAQPERKSA